MTIKTPDSGLAITLLGTGGPTPNPLRAQAATVVWCGDTPLAVDLGEGALGQMLKASIKPAEVDTVLFTHMHWDHILGYPGFVWGSWAAGRQKLSVYGPEGTRNMHEQVIVAPYREQAEWAQTVGFPPAGWTDIRVEDIDERQFEPIPGYRVTARYVEHPPVQAFAYRIDHEGSSIVVSGDTLACPSLAELATGADILVMDACAPLGDNLPAAAARLADFHADALGAARLAAEAGVRKLILTHVTASFDAVGTVEQCRAVFDGEVILGEDLRRYDAK